MLTTKEKIPQLLLEFIKYTRDTKGNTKKTGQEYLYDIRTFFRFLKIYRNQVGSDTEPSNIPIDDVTINDVENIKLPDLHVYTSYLTTDLNNDKATRARKIAALKSFFKYLLKVKLIKENPADDLESPSIPRKLPKYLSLKESKELLNSICEGKYVERDYAIITIFLNCGVRLSELVGINLKGIKENSMVVFGKGEKERTVYLNNASKKALNDYLEVRPRDLTGDARNALFISKQKKRISRNMVHRIVKKYIKLSELDPALYSAHKLRHTFATTQYKHSKTDIRALQVLLGHESISTTEIYTHVDDEKLIESIENHALANMARNVK